MTTQTSELELFPCIVQTHCETALTIHPRSGHLSDGETFEVTVYPLENASHSKEAPWGQILQIRAVNGDLHVPASFDTEQEYLLQVKTVSGAQVPPVELRVYAVEDDLFGRRPYKGDFHMHSSCSDGKESPGYVAGACRRIGMDFMAVTDHRLYAPSLEAMRTFADVDIDLRIYPGEEIHPPDNPVHMINFGGCSSINAMFAQKAAYREEVRAVQESLEGNGLPDEFSRSVYASCLWCYRKIREVGGLGIFCHPYWYYDYGYNVTEALIARHFQDLPFDAYELIGGYHRHEAESNLLQVARYHEERARGRQIPIVGVSDAHGCENGKLFGWYFSIVFAPSPALADIIQNVKGLYSVAVESLPGETPRAHGPFRLVKYAQFLLRQVLPQHDELCREEGKLMLEYINDNTGAAAALKACKGQTAALYRRLWAD